MFTPRRTAERHPGSLRNWLVYLTIMFGLSAPLPLTAATSPRILIAICQILVIDGDREGNFRRIEYALETAQAGHADIATFPESSILGWENPDAHHMATPIPGADSDRIAVLARKYGVMVAIGLDEKDGDHLYDAAILVDKTGKILWKHRKLNVLPELMQPPYSTGTIDSIGVVDTEFGRIGVMICADTFTEKYAQRIAQLKPDLMLIPYGWAAPVEKWPEHEKDLEHLVVSRAKLWAAPTIGTDLVGEMTHGPWKGWTYGGGSVAVDSSGNVLSVLRDRDTEVKLLNVPLRAKK